MSISDTITSIENHIQADYEGLENIGADLTGINKNILNIRTILDTIYNDLPKVTGEGTEVTLTPTRKGRLALIPRGNSTQESTTGKNLFNLSDLSGGCISDKTSTGFKFTRTSYDRFSNTIQLPKTIPSGTTIHSSADITNNTFAGNIQLQFGNDSSFSSQMTSLFNANKTLNIDVNYVRIYVGSSEATNTSCTINNLQIEIGNAKTDYEQYTGGNPAPSPSFPFPIKSVTGNNNVVVHTKNLINNSGIVKGRLDNGVIGYASDTTALTYTDNSVSFTTSKTYRGITTDYISVTNGEYCISSDQTNSAFRINVAGYDSSKNFIENQVVDTYLDTDKYSTFTIASGVVYIRIYMYLVNTGSITIGNLMLEAGNTATTYQPYQNQTKPLNLGSIELNKIGNYQDYIYKNNDKWYKKEVIKKITINSNDISDVSKGCAIISNKYFLDIDFVASYYTFPPILSNIAKIENWNYINEHEDLSGKMFLLKLNDLSNQFRVYLNASTVAEAKTNLDNANAYFMYALATPQDIEITNTQLIEQLEEIDKMKSYEGTTIITSTYDTNNAQMIISASALKGE